MKIYNDRDGVKAVDLHGLHPHDIEDGRSVADLVREGYEMGAPALRIIHGHGFNRDSYTPQFVNSNTGWLGRTVRQVLRSRAVRPYMLVKFDCSDSGTTTVRLRQAKEAVAQS